MDLETAKPKDLEALSELELFDDELLLQLYDIPSRSEQSRVRSMLLARAKTLGIRRDFENVLKSYDEEQARIDRTYKLNTANRTAFSFQEKELYCGQWVADDEGVRRPKTDDTFQWASPIPIVPAAILENISTGTEKIQLDFFKGRKRSIVCERSIVASNSAIVKLADKGLEVNSENAKLLVRYISDVIGQNLDKIPTKKAASVLGWNDCGFMPYSKEIVFDGERENQHLYSAVREKGSLEEWTAFTSELRRNLTLRIMMDASFASVLIEKVNALPFVFHLWGKTGGGKTVSLCLAMSIWGDPALGNLVRTMNMTQNAMLSTAAFLNSIPFAGDELQTIKTRWDSYDQLIMRVTEGIDRGRMHYDKNSETKTWKCSFLFTGEEPCVKTASGGGVVNRVLEFENTEDLFREISGNRVMAFLSKNYGHAGRVFTDHVQRAENLQDRFRELTRQVTDIADTTDKQASSMALILLADALAGECIYKDEQPLDPCIAALYVTDKTTVDIAERAYRFVMDMIAKNIRKFNIDPDYNGEIWGDLKEDSVLFNATVLKQEMQKEGFEFDAVKKEWADRGYLILSSDGRFSSNTKCHGVKARYVRLASDQETSENAEEEAVPF